MCGVIYSIPGAEILALTPRVQTLSMFLESLMKKYRNKDQKLHFLLALNEGRLEGWKLPTPLAMRKLYQSVLFGSGWIVSTYQKQEIAF